MVFWASLFCGEEIPKIIIKIWLLLYNKCVMDLLGLVGVKKITKEDSEGDQNAPKRTRKKKKEVLVWGRRERVFILVMFAGTFLASLVLALYSRGWKVPNLPRMDVSFSGLASQTVVIEKDESVQIKSEMVKAEVGEFTNKFTGIYGLYVYRLGEESGYGIYEDEIFLAASLIKLPVMATLMREAELGRIDLDDPYTLSEEDKIGGSGSLYYKPAGTVVTYREMLELMGKHSDNTAFGIVRRELGERKIMEMMADIGMNNTSLETNETTPRDVGKFFVKLWYGDILEEASRDELLGYLTDTDWEERIPAGVPEEIVVAHKIGNEVGGVYNDAGIVMGEKSYVLIVLSRGAMESEHVTVISGISRRVWEREGK